MNVTMGKETAAALVNAVEQLIIVIQDDEETTANIQEIHIKKQKETYFDRGWYIYASMDDGTAFKYAMYIDQNNQMVCDGF